jgi:hypothetical protein
MAVKLVQPEREIPTEIIAQAIVDISRGMRQINAGRLTRKAVLILLSSASGIGQRDISCVLDNLAALEAIYINKPVPK